MVAGGQATVERVEARCFERHGFSIIGDSSVQSCPGEACEGANVWSMTDDTALYNRGWGLLVIGGDANTGSSIRMQTFSNQLGAIFDFSAEGNSYYDPEGTGDSLYGGVPDHTSTTGLSDSIPFVNPGVWTCELFVNAPMLPPVLHRTESGSPSRRHQLATT